MKLSLTLNIDEENDNRIGKKNSRIQLNYMKDTKTVSLPYPIDTIVNKFKKNIRLQLLHA